MQATDQLLQHQWSKHIAGETLFCLM